MTKLKVALVGCGFFSANHLNAWRDLAERVEIVALCDIDKTKAQAMAKAFGIKGVYTDLAALIKQERPDFVDIATTAPSHRGLVEICAAHGVPAIVQKPLSTDWESACALVEAMERAGLPLMVHENFRFQAPVRTALAKIASGGIGEPVWGRFTFRTGFDIYAGQPYLAEVERFILLDVGIHMLDIARVFMGEAESVYCKSQSIRPGLRGEDTATVLLGHASNLTSVVEMSYAGYPDPDPFPQVILEITGTKGSLRLDPGCQVSVTTAAGTTRQAFPPSPVSWGSKAWIVTQESVRALQTHWLDCLRTGQSPATSGQDNLKTFALVEAAYASARENRSVRPKSWNSVLEKAKL
jgi:predicted dehydrogenase